MNDYIKRVCKIGQGADCCRYLGVGADGLECFKVGAAMKRLIDNAWITDVHVAQGDNCPGQNNLLTATVTESKTNDESENRETDDATTTEKK